MPYIAATTIDVEGVEYFVRDSGPAGEAVLLLHGVPDDGTLWRHQIRPLLDAGHRVICPDLLGFGETSKDAPPERYMFDSMRRDVLALFDRLEVAEVHLI